MKPSYEISPDSPKYGEYCAAYREWMYTPGNAFKCAECPARDDRHRSGYPCGQQNCWVEVTCYPEQFRW